MNAVLPTVLNFGKCQVGRIDIQTSSDGSNNEFTKKSKFIWQHWQEGPVGPLFLASASTIVVMPTGLRPFVKRASTNTTLPLLRIFSLDNTRKAKGFCHLATFKLNDIITVWKFHDFCIVQILREINFEDSWSAKSAILTHLEAKNWGRYLWMFFLKFMFPFAKIEIPQ